MTYLVQDHRQQCLQDYIQWYLWKEASQLILEYHEDFLFRRNYYIIRDPRQIFMWHILIFLLEIEKNAVRYHVEIDQDYLGNSEVVTS